MDQKVSIIIPAHNEANNLAKLLPYLLKHDKALVMEIIVSDGLSTDNTKSTCDQYGVIFQPNNKMGRGYQLAEAAKKATGDYFWFLHADTLPPLTFADDLKSAVESNRNLACFRYRFDSDKKILKINSFFTRFPMMWCRGGDQSLFMSKDIYDSIGGYNPSDIIMEDYNIIKKAKSYGHKLHIIPSEFIVSARKYDFNSYLRVNISNLIVFNLWKFGVDPHKLKSLYHKLINHPMDNQ